MIRWELQIRATGDTIVLQFPRSHFGPNLDPERLVGTEVAGIGGASCGKIIAARTEPPHILFTMQRHPGTVLPDEIARYPTGRLVRPG